MKLITTEWFSVQDVMPPKDMEYRIIRTKDEDDLFSYSMAYFDYGDNDWFYCNRSSDTDKRVKEEVTHWCNVFDMDFTI